MQLGGLGQLIRLKVKFGCVENYDGLLPDVRQTHVDLVQIKEQC